MKTTARGAHGLHILVLIMLHQWLSVVEKKERKTH